MVIPDEPRAQEATKRRLVTRSDTLMCRVRNASNSPPFVFFPCGQTKTFLLREDASFCDGKTARLESDEITRRGVRNVFGAASCGEHHIPASGFRENVARILRR